MPIFLRSRARAARGERRFAEAALLYEELARLRPRDARLRIQCGHMRKDAGDLIRAEAHYRAAEQQLPNDAELALQLGHLAKAKGSIKEAALAYERALALRPGWETATAELCALEETGALAETPAAFPAMDFTREAGAIVAAADLPSLAPSLFPCEPDQLLRDYDEAIAVRRLGRREPSFWGPSTTLRGVEAIRGFCISAVPVLDMQILLNGMPIHQATLKGGYTLKNDANPDRMKKYVFNVWYDFGAFAPGRYKIELRFATADQQTRSFHDTIVIAEPLSPEDYPTSDGIVPMSDPDPVSLAQRIRAAPSVVHPARRPLFPDGVRNVLVMRTDQLGDMVASVPAMRRLRELVPGARIVGLLTVANADLANTLGLFDEVIVIDFPDDRIERRRIMPLEAQEALRRRLATHNFDVALDLAYSNVSRDLLHLAGAKFTHGVGGGDWPWMTSEMGFNTRDRWNAMDIVPHSAKVLAIVETLGAILRDNAPVIRRDDLSRKLLAPFHLDTPKRYIVLHAGARIEFSRWPHFPTLATLLVEQGLNVVMMSEDPGVSGTLPGDLLASERFQFIGRRLPFDVFDAFLSFATVVVGNDSGPKHLAALRGTDVVTLFTARINWAEWGQENVGSIISRRVPCQGCAIFHDAEECGQDFTCIRDIRPDEVYQTVMRHVEARSGSLGSAVSATL